MRSVVPVDTFYGLRVDIEGHEGVHDDCAASSGPEQLQMADRCCEQRLEFGPDVMGVVECYPVIRSFERDSTWRQSSKKDSGVGLDLTIFKKVTKTGTIDS